MTSSRRRGANPRPAAFRVRIRSLVHVPRTPSSAQPAVGRLSRRALLPLALACAAACAPTVAHGPRVQPGTSVFVTAGVGVSPCDSMTCDLQLLPQASLGLRTGRTAGETRPGFSLGASLAVNLISSELDLYAQAPTGLTPLDAGAGVLLSAAHVMPYVQLGRMRENGAGFYTTQGFVLMSTRPTDYRILDMDSQDQPAEMRPRYWAPSLAYRTGGEHGMHLYVSGAFGTADAYDWADGAEARLQRVGSQPVCVLMAGVVFEGEPRDLLPALIPLLFP